MRIIVALLIFSFIVIFHEFGHFIMAKRGGIGVTEFALGMGPKIIGKKIGETEYCWRLLPFGGSCMMVGEDGASEEQNAFNQKGVWTRISVVAAGPIFNFILAFLGALVLVGNVGYNEPVVAEAPADRPAYEAGVRAGDTIISMNGKRIHIFKEITMFNEIHQGETVTLVYEHEGERRTAVIVPVLAEDGRYYFGINGSSERSHGNVAQVVKYSFYEVEYWIRTVLESLKLMFTGRVSGDDIAGPVRIVGAIGDTYEESARDGAYYVLINMINIIVLLSANLGVMNLLPIPALDGGRLVFLLVEAVTRKRIPPEKEGYVHFAGFALLMVLMVLILFNDIRNLII